MVGNNSKSFSNRYRLIVWLIGILFLVITTAGCRTAFLPSPIIITPTLAQTPSISPTRLSTVTMTATLIQTQISPTEKPSPAPTVEPLDPFPVLKPGQYLLYIHEPLPDVSMKSSS